jgi:DNA-directed RNA polymerase specialized sigma24 family protein
VTVYEVLAVPDGRWWSIEVTRGLAKDQAVFTQARRINDIDAVTRDAIALLLQVPADSFELAITHQLPEELQVLVDLFARADALDNIARSESADARSRAAAGLTVTGGLTYREAADLLGISHQRIKQLVDRAPDHTLVDPVQRVAERLLVQGV